MGGEFEANVPCTELAARLGALQRRMAVAGLDAGVVMQNADLYYFTGTLQSGLLYIPAAGEPVYLVRRDAARARRESCLSRIITFGSFRELSGILQDFGLPPGRRIGLELDVLPVALYRQLDAALGNPHIQDVSPLIRRTRAIKSAWELQQMRRAAIGLDEVWRLALHLACEGLTDLELAVALEGRARSLGHPGYARMRAFNGEVAMGMVLIGDNGAVPSFRNTPLGGVGLHPAIGFGPSGKSLTAGVPVTVDLIGYGAGYYADQTRTFALGHLDKKLCRAYDAMCQIQALLVETARPGATWGCLYDECCRLATDLGYAEHFMGTVGNQVSFIGHGIGLEIDEYPFIARNMHDQRLEENMTFAFEPKAVFPGLGAVGIENTFVVTRDGLESLTLSDESLRIL